MDVRERSGHRSEVRWLGAGVVLVAMAALGARFLAERGDAVELPAAGDSTHVEIRRLQRENALLRMELELAGTEQPYLVVDLGLRVLRLKSHGTPLREFAIQEASLRTRRLVGAAGHGLGALDLVWRDGELRPPVRLERVEILADTVAPPDPSGTVAFIPPSPEEAVPAPPAFRIRCAEGRSVIVHGGAPEPAPSEDPGSASSVEPENAGGGTEAPGSILRRAWAWLRMAPWLGDRLSLHLTLSSDDAGALYRAFGNGTPLLVLGSEVQVPGER